MELKSCGQCDKHIVDTVQIDSIGCLECNLSASVPKGEKVGIRGTRFAFLKLPGGFRSKPIRFEEWESPYRAVLLQLNSFAFTEKRLGSKL